MKRERNLVLVIASADAEGARRLVAAPPAGIDAVELRIDRLRDSNRSPDSIRTIVRSATVPLIATCRPVDEGGAFTGPDEERWALLQEAHVAGAALLDIEWSRVAKNPTLIRRWPTERFLLSHHVDSVRSSLEDELLAMLAIPAAGVKVAARAGRFSEAMRLVELTRQITRDGRRGSCFSTGAASIPSRVLSYLAGGWTTYVAADDEPLPGIPLLSLHEALELYRLPLLGDSIKLLGLLGRPLAHSLSPRMQNHVIRRLGERYLYLPFESESPAEVIEFMRRGDVRGLSVTRPHKESVIPWLDGLDETARQIGAVNTVYREGERLIGGNTDFLAMRSILREWVAGGGESAALLGAGGAARAVAFALAERRIPTTIFNRDSRRGRDIARDFGASFGGDFDAFTKSSASIVINATPLGAEGESIPLAPAHGSRRIVDLAYREGGTALEREAASRGETVVDGLGFLARQGAGQFALWTRRLVNPELFREGLLPCSAR